jgi:hypothetical protein
MLRTPAARRAVRTLAAALSALVLVTAGGGQAAAHSPDPWLGGAFAQNDTLAFRWATGGTPASAVRTAILAAAGDSNASRRSKAPVFSYDTAGSNAIYYGTSVPCGVNGLACFWRDPPDAFGMSLRENGHRFDWGTLRWCEMTGDPDGCYEAETITLDELGHVLGLDHHVNYADDSDYTDAVVQTYSRTKPRAGWNAHVFGRCDVATLQQYYDVASATTLYSTCLDVPTVTTLTASKTFVPAVSQVTFTAGLTSNGSGRLAGNPMAARTVVLQVLASAGWTDVATMAAGPSSGSYALTLTVRATATYRAVFRKPSSEGVRTSVSASVTVSVAPCTSGCPVSVGRSTR